MSSAVNPTNSENPQSHGNHKDAKDLAQGALVNFLGMVIKVSKVLFLIVAARYYGKAELGLYLLAWSTIDIVSKIGLMGMDRSIIKDIPRYNLDRTEQNKDNIFGILRFNIATSFCLSLLVTGLLMMLSPIVAELIFKDTSLTKPLRIMVFALPFVVLTHTLIATTKALRIMRYDAFIRSGLEPLVLLIGTLILMPFNLAASGLAIAQVIASFAAASTASVIAFRLYRFLGWRKKSLSKQIKKEIIKYTSPIAAMDFLDLLVFRIDIMMVGRFLGSTSAGIYGIAVEIISIIKRVRQGFEPIFAPIVSELFYSKHKERLKRNYVLVTRWLMAGTFLPVTAIVLFPNQILALFKVNDSAAALALVVLALAHGIVGVFSAAENLLIMTGESLLNTIFAGIMLLVNCVVAVLLIPRIGMVGASIGMLSAFVVVSGARILFGYIKLHLTPFSYSLLWPLATASSTTVIFFLLSKWISASSIPMTIVLLVLMAIFYVGLYFVGAKEPEEKHLIVKFKSKFRRKPAIIKA